jgi:hypothetical protein
MCESFSIEGALSKLASSEGRLNSKEGFYSDCYEIADFLAYKKVDVVRLIRFDDFVMLPNCALFFVV